MLVVNLGDALGETTRRAKLLQRSSQSCTDIRNWSKPPKPWVMPWRFRDRARKIRLLLTLQERHCTVVGTIIPVIQIAMRTKDFEPDEIADAAMRVFWQRGYAATSIQDLVEGTGLSRSSLYNTFKNKQGLYQQALRRYEAVTMANVALLSGAGSPRELIRQLLLRIAEDELGDPQRRGCLAANAALELAGQDPAVAEWVAHNFQRLQKALEKLIQRGQQSGEIAATRNPRALARFFVNTIQGMRVLGKGSPPAQRRQCLMDVIEVALDTL